MRTSESLVGDFCVDRDDVCESTLGLPRAGGSIGRSRELSAVTVGGRLQISIADEFPGITEPGSPDLGKIDGVGCMAHA